VERSDATFVAALQTGVDLNRSWLLAADLKPQARSGDRGYVHAKERRYP
jgi:hypothetical protein